MPGDDIASELDITKTEIGIKFGFRVRKTSAKAVWRLVSDFRRYPRLIDGLEKVYVRGKGKTKKLRLRGKLINPYNVRARVTVSFSRAKGGLLRWLAVDEPRPNTGAMRVDADGDDALVTLATRVRKGVALPDFLILVGLKTAMQAVGEGVRAALVKERARDER